MKQTTARLSKKTISQIEQLKELLDLPTKTAVIADAVNQAVTIAAARQHLSDADFVGFLAQIYRPL